MLTAPGNRSLSFVRTTNGRSTRRVTRTRCSRTSNKRISRWTTSSIKAKSRRYDPLRETDCRQSQKYQEHHVSVIRPFRAVRPAIEKARQVSCVPYDVAHEREVRQFIEHNPESFL